MTILDTIFDTLLRLWLFDVRVFSSPWLYIPFLIPAALYLSFFFLKWAMLTAPVWLPITLVIDAWGNRRR